MKKLMFNIIKLLISVVIQYSIILGSIAFSVAVSYDFYLDYGIMYWVVLIPMFLLGEVGIFLLYTVKPLEKKVHRIIYCIIYMGIHVVGIIIFGYIFILPYIAEQLI